MKPRGKSNTCDVSLGSQDDLADLFGWDQATGTKLNDWIGHWFNQTVVRDLFEGAWTDVYHDGGGVGLKLTSPREDVLAYRDAIPRFLDAGRLALRIYQQNQAAIQKEKLFFFLPSGMALARTRSVQLLHYPPYESRTFVDYLYSPTNRRCEALWAFNGFPEARAPLLERIVDVVPLAGPGSDPSGIDKFVDTFIPYGKAMLGAVLDQRGKHTQPVVAYGTPVRDWLQRAFKDQLPAKLDVLSLVEVRLTDGGPRTPILLANHPSYFLTLLGKKSPPATLQKVTKQDLIAFGWQARMAKRWNADPAKVLREVTAHWDARKGQVAKITAQQKTEFSWGA